MNKTTEDTAKGAGCFLVLVLLVVGFVIYCLFFQPYNPSPPPDDPYYDAPIGRTRGGDTY